MAANAILSLSFTATSSSSSSSSSLLKHQPLLGGAAKRFLRCPVTIPSLRLLAGRSSKATAFAAVAYDETAIEEGEQHVEPENDGIVSEELERKKQGRATEIYVCNLPRSFDTEQLLHMFKSHGTVLSAEVYFFFLPPNLSYLLIHTIICIVSCCQNNSFIFNFFES